MAARVKFISGLKATMSVACWVPVAITFHDFVGSISPVSGRSMQPTLNPDSNGLERDVVVLNRWSNIERKYKIGDVVTLKSPVDPNRVIIKRIVGLEGDFVAPVSRELRSVPAFFKADDVVYNPPDLIQVPPGRCWVEGDESFHSNDSNIFGPVPLGLITSKVEWIIWPLSRMGPLPPAPPRSPRTVTPKMIEAVYSEPPYKKFH
ncbi:hypothetical protein DSO57_1007248 [Entomophthora muscae]|uniref:Uncharacterized protein n=3 Tax=Entomophthora muscae TaxID=34485 RepID=A0ACC2SV54_9FUNG|nr:hypothetical protein DSO57_1035281 [Entomophthora muscae]KAJ9066250.1 hypothetical protein DSO57_1011577 [Entomophthora muscae]KAJ9086133.1 hypothetical protein DSO57_1007248 [Entomophthora muscae]